MKRSVYRVRALGYLKELHASLKSQSSKLGVLVPSMSIMAAAVAFKEIGLITAEEEKDWTLKATAWTRGKDWRK